MKKLKRIFAGVLGVVLLVGSTRTISAQELNTTNNEEQRDIYSEELQETVTIDEVEYTYHYMYNDNGDKVVSISNNENDHVDVIVAEEDTGNIELNGEFCGYNKITMGTIFDNIMSARAMARATNWKYLGSANKYVSWAMGTSVAAVAGVIGVALDHITGAQVLFTMGGVVVGAIASNSIGGTVSMKIYKFNSSAITQFRYDWKFRARNGDNYGPYMNLTQV